MKGAWSCWDIVHELIKEVEDGRGSLGKGSYTTSNQILAIACIVTSCQAGTAEEL